MFCALYVLAVATCVADARIINDIPQGEAPSDRLE
jgi:hypothetical protein